MVANEVCNNFLLVFIQSNHGIGFDDVIAMLVMVNRVDEMTDVMQERTHFQQEALILTQIMKLRGLIE